ncbi:trehalose utilization-domain-containing protein [Mycena floridula]|nr:trehalose utilization-domain-containing protein [Mycena floridula]
MSASAAVPPSIKENISLLDSLFATMSQFTNLDVVKRILLLSLLFLITAPLSTWSIPSRVLIYSYTDGFRHDSIPTATEALKKHGSTIGCNFDSTEDMTAFTDANLAQYDGLLFLSTTGEVLTSTGKQAFQKYLNLGGNFIGVHAASACMVNTTDYTRELGSYFDYHPEFQNATIDVVGDDHPSTSMLPREWHVQDEIYSFTSDPRALGAKVVLIANESSYVDPHGSTGVMGPNHPIAWFQEHGSGSSGIAGRSFYSALGHSNASWEDETFLAHILGGIQWAVESGTTLAYNQTALIGNPGLMPEPSPAATTTRPVATGSVSSATLNAPKKATVALLSLVLLFCFALL